MNYTCEYLDLVINKCKKINVDQGNKILKIAKMFYDVTLNNGLVQIFGYDKGEEFVNELDYRAGGLITIHAIRPRVAVMNKHLDMNEYRSLSYLNNPNLLDIIYSEYEMSKNDMFCLVSYKGNEPLIIEMARRAKLNGQKVVCLINMASYQKNHGELLKYVDEYLDYDVDDPEYALNVNGISCGQYSATVMDVVAQEITAEVYKLFMENEGYAPILMSSNLKDSDANNLALIEKYGGSKRVHFNG